MCVASTADHDRDGEVAAMGRVMKWINSIVDKLARRKVERDEGRR